MSDRKLIVRFIIEAVLVGLIAFAVITALHDVGMAEDAEYQPLYVVADVLNGRAHPTKKAPVEAVFDYGDQLIPTGKISKDRKWVEVAGGESGTVWVSIQYVSERFTEFTVINENNGKIKIRSKPVDGKIKGYVKRGKEIEIDRVVLGWGHCSKGWVDLEYFIEEDE